MYYAHEMYQDYDAHCPKCGYLWEGEGVKDPGYFVYHCLECDYTVHTLWDELLDVINPGNPIMQKDKGWWT